MPALLFNVLRRWLIAALVVPLAVGVARRTARSLEARRGRPTTVTRGLTKAADVLQRDGDEAEAAAEGAGRRRGLFGRRK